MNRLLARGGHAQVAPPEYGFMHAERARAGLRHRSRDIGAAPWPEDRVPGTRYDTIDRGESPTAPVRLDRPALILDPDTVDSRGRALLGANHERTVAWPCGLAGGAARSARKDPEPLAGTAHLAVARSTFVSWADHYGLKPARRVPCCTRWLTRPTHRACRLDPMTGARICWDGDSYGRGWRDHPMAWTTTEGQPAALTSAPYGSPKAFTAELDFFTHLDDRLAWASGGAGWYGLSTHQIVVWRRDLLGDVETADRIRDAVQGSLGDVARPGDTT
ncbi:hypothetical protein [Streptomyces sp. CJ_13]|uniref:hypothetical protein n=1 Tax=Streptomyces sp. CJ_13 TaxID=2724943 RepID=UPI0027E27B6D|nr:hypothetical protein [Streptomyces sp. CJ_13]